MRWDGASEAWGGGVWIEVAFGTMGLLFSNKTWRPHHSILAPLYRLCVGDFTANKQMTRNGMSNLPINFWCYLINDQQWRKTVALNVTLQCNVLDKCQHPPDCGMSALSQSVHLSFFKSLALICLSVCRMYNHLWLCVPLCSVWLIFKPLRTRQEA